MIEPYWQKHKAKLYVGDARSILDEMDKCSVQTCITSPPYFRLRDYDNPHQIGREDTPEEFIQELVNVFSSVREVLKDDGTLWVNIADTYMTSSKRPKNSKSEYKIKDMIGIPWMLAFALRKDGWYLRQDTIWNKTNARPENARDRCDGSHEYLFLLSKSPKYYFDYKAIQEPSKSAGRVPGGNKKNDESRQDSNRDMSVPVAKMRNKRSVWNIATKGNKKAHFAVFPDSLIEPCIKASCPKDSIVLDPFSGSGTTMVSALKSGHDALGIELNKQYADDSIEDIDSAIKLVKNNIFG